MGLLDSAARTARELTLWGIERTAGAAAFVGEAAAATAGKLAAGKVGVKSAGEVMREAAETAREVGDGARNLAILAGDVPAFFADRAVTLFGRSAEPLKSFAELLQDPDRSINSFDVLLDMMHLFLKGPAAIVVGDTIAQMDREWAERKAAAGGAMTLEDVWQIRHALTSINGSRLYPESYRDHVYPALSTVLSEAVQDQLEGETFYPPSHALMEIAREMDLDSIRHTIAFLKQTIADNASDPRVVSSIDTEAFEQGFEEAKRKDIEAAGTGVDPYKRYCELAWRLIREVSLGAATGFLSKAIVTMPEVEDYLEAVSEDPSVAQERLPPPSLRVFMYVSDANLEGESIYSATNPLHRARVPFPPETSQLARDFLDAYVDTAAGERRKIDHLFYSARRIIFTALHHWEKEDVTELTADEVVRLAGGPSGEDEIYPRFRHAIEKTLEQLQEQARQGADVHQLKDPRFSTHHATVIAEAENAGVGR